MKKKMFQIVILCSTVYLSGCVDLKAVNTTASESLTAIKKYNEVGSTFSKFCNNETFETLVTEHKIYTEPEIKYDCQGYYDADKVTNTLYSAVASYFKGLVDLSNENLTSIKTDALKQALIKGKFGPIIIEESEVNAYDKFTSSISNIFLKAYRKNQLSKAISEANEPLKTVIATFQKAMINLRKEYDRPKVRLNTIYKLMSDDSTLSNYEKLKAGSDYYQLLAGYQTKQKQIDVFVASLAKIQEAHQKLYDNRSRLKAKDIKAQLLDYAGTIQDLVDQFNKLKSN